MRTDLKVTIVDDHPLFREGVRLSLAEAGFTVVAEGESAVEAVNIARTQAPDILLLDISLPGGGIESIKPILDVRPEIKIVMLTASDEDDDLHRALQSGVRGYILKGIGAGALADILDQIASDQQYVAPTLSAKLLARPTADRVMPQLTEREQQILDLLLEGSSNQKIARKLDLQEKTVKHHMTRVFLKLKATNRTQAALTWRRIRRFYVNDHHPELGGGLAAKPSLDGPVPNSYRPSAGS